MTTSVPVGQPRLRISEIFYSLQGESDTSGIPTVFVRLAGCPLRCTWCDTEYAFSGGSWMSLDEIVGKVAEHRAHYVTVTGGEPLAQKSCRALLTMLCDAGYRVSLETGGALDLSGVDKRVTCVMDLKPPASGECHRNLYENIEHLKAGDQIKFVISGREDYEWARDLVRGRNLPDECQVLFSPVWGTDAAALAEWILSDHLAVRFQLQLHKLLWGERPGR